MIRLTTAKTRVLFPLVLIALGVGVAFGGTGTGGSKPDVGLTWHRRALAAADEREALREYEQRDTNVAPWVEEGPPPNPDNAALLYYQAFLLAPEPNMAMNWKLTWVLGGAEPDTQVRTYLGHCLPMMDMAEIASRIPQCTWGIWHGPEPRFTTWVLEPSADHLESVLLVDARILAADGHYQAALERCLTLRRLARHLSEDPDLHFTARSRNTMALRTVQHVLGVMPPDAEILSWFRSQLAVVQGLSVSFGEMLQENSKSFFHLMQTNPGTLVHLRNLLVEGAKDQQAKENALNLTDDQLLSRSRESFPHSIDSILRILDSEMAYDQKLAQMQGLVKKLKQSADTDPVVKCVVLVSGTEGLIDQQYPYLVGCAAHINGIKAAVEIYLVVAETGRLPEKLPAHLPKDPFTGRDFGYEVTDEGFALRCQGKEFPRRKDLEFKVRE